MTPDNLSQQIINISKAAAYDVTVTQITELKQVIRDLIEVGELDDIEFTDKEETNKFKVILKRAKILSL